MKGELGLARNSRAGQRIFRAFSLGLCFSFFFFCSTQQQEREKGNSLLLRPLPLHTLRQQPIRLGFFHPNQFLFSLPLFPTPPSFTNMSSGPRVQKVLTQPINLIFRFLQNKTRIQIWLFDQSELRIEGVIIGFDEYMNLVLDQAEEVNLKKKSRKTLGRILLKGDNITLMMKLN